METKSYKSVNIEKNWHLVDAKDKVLGRLAVKIASGLSGKNKAQYSPNADLGDFVVVVNAEKVKVTGNKFSQKNYYHHTGYPGGLKTKSFEKMQEIVANLVNSKKITISHANSVFPTLNILSNSPKEKKRSKKKKRSKDRRSTSPKYSTESSSGYSSRTSSVEKKKRKIRSRANRHKKK